MAKQYVQDVVAAAQRASNALIPFLDGEPDTMDIQEACLALEEVERVGGVQSLAVTKLRRALEKRGLNRA